MDFLETTLPDVWLLRPRTYEDARGFFRETYRADRFAEQGLRWAFLQHNHSASRQGVLRGLHYQIKQPQGKLVRVIQGEVYDVAVDLRKSSATFGQWVGVSLSAAQGQQLWVPPGFAHGFLVLSDWAEVIYLTTDYYAPQWERTLRWDDPELAIAWPLGAGQAPSLSEKDAAGTPFAQAEVYD